MEKSICHLHGHISSVRQPQVAGGHCTTDTESVHNCRGRAACGTARARSQPEGHVENSADKEDDWANLNLTEI